MANIMASAGRLTFTLALLLRIGDVWASLDVPANASTAPPAGYSLSYDKDLGNENFSVFRMAISEPFGVFGAAFAASDDPRLKPLTRLDSAWNLTAPLVALPMRLGDAVSSAGLWNQPARLGGLQIGTIVSAPPEVVAPQSLIASPYETSGPVAQTSSRFIDHLRSMIQIQRQALQTAGQGDFSLEAGRLREDFEVRSNVYGPWITSGTYRYGLSATTTVDGQLAQVSGQQNYASVGVVEGLGGLGLASARLEGSHDPEVSGWLARMAYDFDRDYLRIALRSHIQSPGFQDIGDPVLTLPLRQRTLASAGFDMGAWGRISLASAKQTYVDYSRRDIVALSHAMRVTGGGIFSTAAAYSPGQSGNTAWLLTLSYPFDVSSSAGHATDNSVSAALDRTLVDAFGQTRLPAATRPTER